MNFVKLTDFKNMELTIRPDHIIRVENRPYTGVVGVHKVSRSHIVMSDGERIGLLDNYDVILKMVERESDIEFIEFSTANNEKVSINPKFVIRAENNVNYRPGIKAPTCWIVCSDGMKIPIFDEYKEIEKYLLSLKDQIRSEKKEKKEWQLENPT